MASSGFLDLLQCPRCRRAPLVPSGERLACRGCRVDYPRLGGLPWLFAEPELALGEWRNRLTLYLEEFAAAERAAQADLASATRDLTRARVARLRDAYREQAALVRGLLEPLALASLPLPHATPLAFGDRLPLSQDLHSYYANVHRDWCWGGEENAASHAEVAAALGGGAQRVLVLGAGGGRLAYDLHQHGAQALTVALDINPLLLLVAERVVRGGRVELYEFPIAPLSGTDVALRRELAAPAAARPGLELVFADAWRAPFAAQSFDAIVTPWLIDIVDVDFESIALAVNRLLVPGGRWVNFGSLAFPWRRPSLRYGPEELRELLAEAGFEVGLQRDAALPYMRSPASRHARIETVALFAADKRRRGPREPAEAWTPPWLRDTALPVPRSDALALAADASRIQAVLLALVDGQRSIDELAGIVAEQGLLPAAQAGSAVRGLLERLHRAAERNDHA
ncbi:MAG TPA: class I SAM-dependent methyltransferase [Steroidobacteraceae bacterium]|nr:class I SAM-dependent methyltransferase [Steroidobacteraceae bacterium]